MQLLLAMLLSHQVMARTWEEVPGPIDGTPEVFGTYAKGCMLGADELPEATDIWEIVNTSRNRHYAHPSLTAFLTQLGLFSKSKGYGKLILGDTSLPAGGKLVSGHASHQMGLDADIRFDLYPANKTMTTKTRNNWPEVDIAEMKTIDANSWSCRILEDKYKPEYMELLRASAMDPVVNRIFVSPALKKRLCELYNSSSNPAWLLKVRPYTGHTAHFHVRLNCPADSPTCMPQPLTKDPSDPTGVGCDGHSLLWWLTGEDKSTPDPNPPPPPPKPELPAICADALKNLRIVKLPAQIRCSAIVKDIGDGSGMKTYMRCHDYKKHRNFPLVSSCKPDVIEKRPSACVKIP